MSDTLETLKEYLIEDGDWHQINDLFPDAPNSALTIKNLSGSTVSVFSTSDTTITADSVAGYMKSKAINPPEIGGVNYEISSGENELVFIRAPSGSGKVNVRIYGTVDPSADLSELAKMLVELGILLDKHTKTTSGNPHHVTKSDVKLENIPNAITHDVDDAEYGNDSTTGTKDPKETTVSLTALRMVRDIIMAHIRTVAGNPHQVTKSDVKLGSVANYPPATNNQAIDPNNDATYLTPKTGAIMVKDIVQVAASVKPQTVVSGQITSRLPGWSQNDITVPSKLVTQSGSRGFIINAGLSVAYAYRGKANISQMTEQDIIGYFAATMPDGVYYIYLNFDQKGAVLNYGATHDCPTAGVYKEATYGDFFNTANCTMMTADGAEIQRVYIAKAYFSSNKLLQVLSVPFGDQAIIPVVNTLALGKSALVANPFIDRVEVTALAEYGDKWAETRWNDQTGIIASPKPNDEYNNILVQVGQVGFLTSGASSGAGFGESFTTVTVAPRVALKLKKEY